MLRLKAEDAVHNLGTVHSDDEATLRAFVSAYNNDPKTIGSLALNRSTGDVIATYNVWTNGWKDADAINA
tara:strand:- start:15180 stop:15389 length:210 start_codon:yes stop_codon:yes gene_type:complete